MKLSKDFGVRALIATLAGVGYYGSIGYVLVTSHLDFVSVIAILGMAQAPFLSAVAFYFATRNQTPPKGEGDVH